MAECRGCAGKTSRPDCLHGAMTMACDDAGHSAARDQTRKRSCILKPGSVQMGCARRKRRIVKRQHRRFLRGVKGIRDPVQPHLVETGARVRQDAVQRDQLQIRNFGREAQMLGRESGPSVKGTAKREWIVMVAGHRQKRHRGLAQECQGLRIVPCTAVYDISGQDNGIRPHVHRRDLREGLQQSLCRIMKRVCAIVAQMRIGELRNQSQDTQPENALLPWRASQRLTASRIPEVMVIAIMLIAIPVCTEPCSNWEKTKVPTVRMPAGASMIEATNSREAIAKTSIMAAISEGAISGRVTWRSA